MDFINKGKSIASESYCLLLNAAHKTFVYRSIGCSTQYNFSLNLDLLVKVLFYSVPLYLFLMLLDIIRDYSFIH